MMNKITILGSGTSTGVPILGCKCSVCQSTDVRNKRLRTSALIEFHDEKKVLIDASPDLRTQLLKTKIDSLDAVIITHDHADHTHGMDDLRPFCFRTQTAIPVYSDESAGKDLRRKFQYLFDRKKVFADRPILGGGIPLLDLEVIAPGSHQIAGHTFNFHALPHGHEESLSIIQGKLGYVVDCRMIPDETLKHFHDAKLEILIIDCLRREPHQTHLHLDLTLEYIQNNSPKLAVLTHMGHEWDYLSLMSELRTRGTNNVFPAQDGQSFLYSNA